MCKGETHMVRCSYMGISIIILSVMLMSFYLKQARFDTPHCILFTGLINIILGAVCLILGAVLIKRVLLWVWLVVSLPAALMVIVSYGIILASQWGENTDFGKAVAIIIILIFSVKVQVAFCFTARYVRELCKEHHRG